MALLNARNCKSTIISKFATSSPQPVVCRPTMSLKSNQGHIPYSNLIKFNELVLHQSIIDINSWVSKNRMFCFSHSPQ
jgi:hypothetical protein